MFKIRWITDNIAVSPAFSSENILDLREQNIDAIVDLRSEAGDDREALRREGIDLFHIPVADTFAPDFRQIKAVMGFVNPLLDQNKKILVHCQNGYGRSPLVIVAILVNRGTPFAEALKTLKQGHPEASFSIHQLKFLKKLEEAQKKQRSC